MQIDFHIIKTSHSESPRQGYDPSEYYTDDHVVDLVNQIRTYFRHPSRIHLLSNNTTLNMPDISIKDVTKYGLWGWWNKMLVFGKEFTGPDINIYIDLDTVIQRDFSDLVEWVFDNQVTMLYSFWKPIDWESQAYRVSGNDPSFKHVTLVNSSIMVWRGNQLNHITDGFLEDQERALFNFRGNDEYMDKFHKQEINVLPRGWAYSYFFGAEEGSEFFPKDKESFKIRPDYTFRLLNGEGKRTQEYYDTRRPDRHVKEQLKRENSEYIDDARHWRNGS
jgi:hypothetical protein|tara:strand:+ start:3821 stop:4651 length:831 start_codon:yes stop_codon:yes gene_type:complete